MSKRTWAGIVTGVVLIGVGVALRGLAKQEGLQILLALPTPIIVGIVLGRVRLGLLWGFVLAFGYSLVNTAVFQSGSFTTNISQDLALVVFAVIAGLFAAVLATVGALIARLVWKRQPLAR